MVAPKKKVFIFCFPLNSICYKNQQEKKYKQIKRLFVQAALGKRSTDPHQCIKYLSACSSPFH
ncbi:hypothetical protein, partial [Kingella kingae]|uniref:hypothetical protein n=1 Tax=Kingella kingae TaxID=504 RepID=UPI001E2DFFC7